MMTMETYTGLVVDPLELSIVDIQIEDIAHALSQICRFGGHCREFYSVAQHSYHVAYHLGGPPQLQLFGLLHDAAEAYLGDVIHPIKEEIPQYELREKELLKRIHFRFHLGKGNPSPTDQNLIKEVDTRMLITEAKFLMPSQGKDWRAGVESYPFVKFGCWSPEKAKRLFLYAFETYTGWLEQ